MPFDTCWLLFVVVVVRSFASALVAVYASVAVSGFLLLLLCVFVVVSCSWCVFLVVVMVGRSVVVCFFL